LITREPRFAVWLTFFNTWVLFEETVVDRYGLWEYMPDADAMKPIALLTYRDMEATLTPRKSSSTPHTLFTVC
jgi:hypothetical protein